MFSRACETAASAPCSRSVSKPAVSDGGSTHHAAVVWMVVSGRLIFPQPTLSCVKSLSFLKIVGRCVTPLPGEAVDVVRLSEMEVDRVLMDDRRRRREVDLADDLRLGLGLVDDH